MQTNLILYIPSHMSYEQPLSNSQLAVIKLHMFDLLKYRLISLVQESWATILIALHIFASLKRTDSLNDQIKESNYISCAVCFDSLKRTSSQDSYIL